MKGPILCSALCAAALFNGGCGEDSTRRNAPMDEEEEEFMRFPGGWHEGIPRHLPGADEPEEALHRKPDFRGRQHTGPLTPVFAHPPGMDEMRTEEEFTAAEGNAAVAALNSAAPSIPELTSTGWTPKEQLSAWCDYRPGGSPAIYFHHEAQKWGFLSNFATSPIEKDISVSVRWLRQQARAAAFDARKSEPSEPGNDEGPFDPLERLSFFSAEQLFMYIKALVMKDEKSAARVAALTNGSRSSMEAKKLGRDMAFSEEVWKVARFAAMSVAVEAKFGVDSITGLSDLGEDLLGTGRAMLVEASPRDSIWGIGADAAEGRAGKWNGLNLLGWALMEARRKLQGRP